MIVLKRGLKKERLGLKVQKSFGLDREGWLWFKEEGEKHGESEQSFINWYLNGYLTKEQIVVERLIDLEAAICKKEEIRLRLHLACFYCSYAQRKAGKPAHT